MPGPRTNRSWPDTSPSAGVLNNAIILLSALAVATAAAVVIADLIRERQASLKWLLGPAIPLLVIGQVWSTAVMRAWTDSAALGTWPRGMSSQRRPSLSHKTLTVYLPKPIVFGLEATFILGWLVGFTAIFWARDGGPAVPTATCRWPLVDHGLTTCVSHATYLEAGAALQRLVAGVLMGFFAMHLLLALAQRVRRRRVQRHGAET